MKTNFEAWHNHYGETLVPYYRRFCSLFEVGEEPSYLQFMIHCFRNTRQTYDTNKKRWSAPIY